jgi:DNA-binding NarL/FixJ family response regulator
MSKKIKISIADDHNLVLQSIALALSSDPELQVVAQAVNGRELLDGMDKADPDVVLLDLQMPVLDGWETLGFLKKDYPHCKVVIVSMYFDELFIKDLVSRGAHGFLPKNADFETLISAIHEVHDLGYFFSGKINRSVVKELLAANTIHPRFSNEALTEKELETLRLICADKLNKEIAEILDVAERTVDRYRTALYEKTKTKTVAGLVLYALKNNLITVFNKGNKDQTGIEPDGV